MFDNIVLDVVTGLVFIYLLYSLLLTVIGEYLSFKLGIRPRLLRFAIEKMLNDGYYSKVDRSRLRKKEKEALEKQKETLTKKKEGEDDEESKPELTGLPFFKFKAREWILKGWWSWLRKFALYESSEFKKSFAGKFYQQSSIKYLSKIDGKDKKWFNNSKPSYLSADYFAEALISLLKEKGAGETDDQKVDFCLVFNTHNIQPETLRHILNLWTSSKEDLTVFKIKLKQWYDETMDRANGWYKQKMQFISLILGFIIAAAFNVNSIEITRILAKDKEARGQLVEMSVKLANDSAKYRNYSAEVSDSIRGQSVDSVYTLLRKDIDAANSILGLGWDLSSLQKDKQCEIDTNDQPIFKKLIARTGSFNSIEKSRELSVTVRKENAIRDSLRNVILSMVMDSVIIHQELKLAENDSVAKVIQKKKIEKRLQIKREIIGAKKIRRQLFNDSIALRSETEKVRLLKDLINEQTGEDFLSITSIELSKNKKGVEVLTIDGNVSWRWYAKFWYWLGRVFANFSGLFITAIALSFGAPFWFDLLKKIVSLRSGGVKPEEKAVQPKVSPAEAVEVSVKSQASVIASKGKDRIEEALLNYGPLIQSIAGVKSVFSFVEDSKTKSKNIQINVIDALTEAEITRRFDKLMVGDTVIKPRIKITGKAITHQGEGMIHLKGTRNSEGSLGIILKKKDTGSKHVLSCWHVMKDLNNSTNQSSIILDHNNENLADRWAGGIRDSFDYALARCFDDAAFKSNDFLKQHLNSARALTARAVTQNDIDDQIKIKYIDFLSGTPVITDGHIFTDSKQVEIEYPDMTRTVTDIIVLTKSLAQEKTISQPGNSGSVVFDSDNRAIAMIIAGDLDFTYAIKLSNILGVHTEMTIA